MDGTPVTMVAKAGDTNAWSVGCLTVGSHTFTIKVTNGQGLVSNVLSYTITSTATASATQIVFDDFARTDGVLGVTSTKQPWFTISGTPVIISQKVKMTGVSDNLALINNVVADFTAQVTITYGGGAPCLIFRSDGGTNQYGLLLASTKVAVRKNYSTTIGTDYAFTPVVGTDYVLKVVCSGSTVNCYINGTLAITFTDSSYAAYTYGGLYVFNDSVSRFDGYTVTTN